ncbi:uncharacterized protein T551_02280 [Pneumocystis jirovecii RU7]|uniref:SP-RING-type domain-containing protein n=1 Tax=Pneumocystis jirovecii (strain RU7) TaxID=1408657 RepID=A0A0W4ZKV7_PNEJ7|nr:uncharacterized protein T551_02280 [Pneumocystis jirovecii RU7]KTW29006.1 hypothetical protein T551_02280 [Pneumocystis jirovecii RU7]
MQYLPPFQNYPLIVNHLENRLLVTTLKVILREYGLPVSGKKHTLITRVRELLDKVVETKDVVQYERLKNSIMGIHFQPHSSCVVSYGSKNMPSVSSPSLDTPISSLSLPKINVFQRINFKPSPFYNILETINSPIICLPTLRDVITTPVQLSLKAVEKLTSDESYRVYLFCTATDSAAFGLALIEFPVHIDLKVNGKHVNANTRGLKKKPGTAPPVDITSLLFLDSKIINRIEMTCASTEKRYSFGVYLVQKYTANDLIERIKVGKYLSKDYLLDKLKKDSEDGDIITTASDISLKDPISYTRIELPCRSLYCNHLQCFDAYSFLVLNEQTPTWQCPICNKLIYKLEDLAIDSYTLEILNSVSSFVESVTINPNGTWSTIKSDINNELSGHNEYSNTPMKDSESFADKSTHETSFGQGHSVLSSLPKSSQKRSASAIIDLTLDSDDENNIPSPPFKKYQNNSVETPTNKLSSGLELPKININLSSLPHIPRTYLLSPKMIETRFPLSTDPLNTEQSLNSIKLSTLDSKQYSTLCRPLEDNNIKEISTPSTFLNPLSTDLWTTKDNSYIWQDEFRKNNFIDIHSTHS